MKRVLAWSATILFIFFVQCSSNKCTIREWKLMDVYRNNYPSVMDTTCGDSILLVNKLKIPSSFLDSVFDHIGNVRLFSFETGGIYQLDTVVTVPSDGINYDAAKVRYLHNGYNVDQEFLLYVIKGKGILIQQESRDRKLFLLSKIARGLEKPENTIGLTNELLKDTVLFPLPPE